MDVIIEDDLSQDYESISPTTKELLPLLNNSMSTRLLCTGYFNGYAVEVRDEVEIGLIYNMGFFGKSSISRSKPHVNRDGMYIKILRKRQFDKRSYWHNKFLNSKNRKTDVILRRVEEIMANIQADAQRDVIDLVSSGEESDSSNEDSDDFTPISDNELAVVIPNSDSEEENYFEKLKPKCCINKVTLPERLVLTLQEAFFLMFGMGCLQINDESNKMTLQECWILFQSIDKNFVVRYVVYHYFRSKGYVVKPGIKFGGDYLLYRDGPGIRHADYIVVIRHQKDMFQQNWTHILGHVRMANTTVKEILIAEVNKKENVLVDTPTCLSEYSVREIQLTRKNCIPINEEVD